MKSLSLFYKPFFLLPLYFFSWEGLAQQTTETARFEIVVLGIKIGQMTAQKVAFKDSLAYKVDSQVSFWFFGDVDLRLNNRAHLIGGKITKAYSDSKTNRGNFASKIIWNGIHYTVDATSYKYSNRSPLSGPHSWCSTKMFFHEPSGNEMFLSEVYGLASPIKKIGTNIYEINLNGNTTQYHYKAGKLEKIVVESTIKDYQVRRIQ
ncbi:MAG: hypothetical protein RL407_1595 [Bacteroidota bacterium]|jgi:hypothetical protein